LTPEDLARLEMIRLEIEKLSIVRMESIVGAFELDPDSRLGIFMRNMFLSMDLSSPKGIKNAMSKMGPQADIESLFLQGLSVKTDPVLREYERISESIRYLVFLSTAPQELTESHSDSE
jgi:hypothetical protein